MTATRLLTSFARTEGCTASSVGVTPTCPIGAKSRTGSYGIFLYNPGLMACVDTVAISKVYPSGDAFATTSAPMLPPAPVLFSATNCCPSSSPIFAPMRRATTSVGPPAAKGTTMRIGFDGYPTSAFTAALANAKAAIVPPKAERAVSFNHPAGVKTEVSLSRPAITLHQRRHPAEGACPVPPGVGRRFGVTITPSARHAAPDASNHKLIARRGEERPLFTTERRRRLPFSVQRLAATRD